ncbi:MAG: AAC(3) family N-acetyltransferase [Verrucomicrobia bacterium]|nr:AAC(3) family N-acetyltransferase [Verrucomicrobiota bacterium]
MSSEAKVIQNTKGLPATPRSIIEDLVSLGIRPGDVLLIHSSLSALGWVCGGAPAVISALLDTLGPTGTLVMPSHSAQLTDPASWTSPPVPDSWWQIIREQTLPYDPAITPTRGMGAIAEAFRSWPGVVRSAHPLFSFSAHGPKALEIVSDHSIKDFGLGERSPLARLYDLDASILLLGVGFDKNTSLHLSEYRSTYPGKKLTTEGAPVLLDRRRVWITMQELEFDTTDFAALGQDLIAKGFGKRARVANADAYLMKARELVDFGVSWLNKTRGVKGVS